MDNKLSTRQVCYLLLFSMMATKFKRLPAILSQELQRDGWIMLLLMFVIDMIMLLITLRIMKWCDGHSVFERVRSVCGGFVAKSISFLFIVYFLMKVIIFYKSTHNFFSDYLFNNLSWEFFSIIFIIVIWYVTSKGINAIGRNSEMFFGIVAFGFIGAVLLAFGNSDLSKVLPILDQPFLNLLKTMMHHDLWFADFLIIIMMIGNIKVEKNTNMKITITYIIGALFAVLVYILFYGIFENTGSLKTHALTAFTQFSMMGLDIGRIDWILVLLTLFGTIISTCLLMWFVGYEVMNIIEVKKTPWVMFFSAITLYLLDLFVISNTELFGSFIERYMYPFTMAIHFLIPIFIWIVARISFTRQERKGIKIIIPVNNKKEVSFKKQVKKREAKS